MVGSRHRAIDKTWTNGPMPVIGQAGGRSLTGSSAIHRLSGFHAFDYPMTM
jgi:hypothetical protein